MEKLNFILSIFFLLLSQAFSAQELSFYQVDTFQSHINWKCDKHNGSIKLLKGGFVVDKDSIIGGLFVIDMKSIKNLDMNSKQYKTAVMILENTLKNEFFEVEKYPVAIFKLEKIGHLQGDIYQLTGDFSLHAQTICISFIAKIQLKKHKIILQSEKFTIDRTDWGIYRMSAKRPYSDDENGWTVPDSIELLISLTSIYKT